MTLIDCSKIANIEGQKVWVVGACFRKDYSGMKLKMPPMQATVSLKPRDGYGHEITDAYHLSLGDKAGFNWLRLFNDDMSMTRLSVGLYRPDKENNEVMVFLTRDEAEAYWNKRMNDAKLHIEENIRKLQHAAERYEELEIFI